MGISLIGRASLKVLVCTTFIGLKFTRIDRSNSWTIWLIIILIYQYFRNLLMQDHWMFIIGLDAGFSLCLDPEEPLYPNWRILRHIKILDSYLRLLHTNRFKDDDFIGKRRYIMIWFNGFLQWIEFRKSFVSTAFFLYGRELDSEVEASF